jgi:type III secretion system low calcium response chaperone LcrH/SycD
LPQHSKDEQHVAENIADIAAQAIQGSVIVKEKLGITDGQMEAMYAVAFNQFQKAAYDDAIQSFSLLCLLNPLEYKYMFGFASSFYKKGSYELASLYYVIASKLDTGDPSPFLHAAECMLAINDTKGANEALALTLSRIGDSPQYAPLRKRVESMLERIE